MMQRLMMLAALALLTGSPALAQTDPAPAAAAASVTSTDDNKQICKKEKPTGSRLAAKKVCRTKAEWDEFYRQQRQETEQMQRNDMAIKTPKG